MNRLLRIVDLSKNEQRVVLFIIVMLITIAFAAYERRVHHLGTQHPASVQAGRSPSPVLSEDRQ